MNKEVADPAEGDKETGPYVADKVSAILVWFFFGLIGGHSLFVGRKKWGLLYILLIGLFWATASIPELVTGGSYAYQGGLFRVAALVSVFVLWLIDLVRIIFFDFCKVDLK